MQQSEHVLGVHVRLLDVPLGRSLLDLVVQYALALLIRHVEGMLDNVVAELVLQQLHHGDVLRIVWSGHWDGADSLEDILSILLGSGLETVFHHV